MNDDKKTKKQLIEELTILRQRTAQFDNPEEKSEKTSGSPDNITGQVQESMEQLILALDASNDGLFDWNMQTGKAYFNPRYYTMLGYEPDEFPASYDSWINMIDPEDRTYALEIVNEYAENKRDSHEIEYRMNTKAGGQQWILSRARMIARDETGKPVRMVGTHTDITKRKLAEIALEESEEKFRRLSDSSPVGIFQTGRDGDVVYLNDRWSSITGMTREDAMGFGWTQALHPDDKPWILAEWDECLKEKKGYTGEFRFVRSSGEIRWVYTKTSPFFSTDGEVIGHVGAIKDITDRKNTEKILVEEKEFTETALNAQQDTFFVFDPATGKTIRWNKTFRDISGYSDAEIAEMKAPDSYYSAEDLVKAAANIKAVLKGEKVALEMALITKDGRHLPTEYTASPILDETGQPQYIISIGRDITERRLAENAILESERRYRLLIENTPIVAWITNKEGKTKYISPNVEKVYGYTPSEIIAGGEELWFGRIHEEDIDNVTQVYKELFSEQKQFNIEYRIKRKNGEWIWLHDRANVVVEREGTLHAYGVFSDITEGKRAAEELKESEEKFSKAFHTSIDLIAISSLENGFFVDVNDAFLEVLGYQRDEVIGRTSKELQIWVDPNEKERIIKKISDAKTCKDIEIQVRKKNGDVLHGLFSATRINLSDGPVMLSMMKDISERKRAGDLLKIQRDLSFAFSETNDLNQLMQELLNAALKMEGIDAGGIYLRNVKTGALDLVSHQGLPEQFVSIASHYNGDAPQAQLIAQGNPIHGHYQNLGIPLDENHKKEPLKAISIIPIKHEGDVIGVINLASYTLDEFPHASHDAIESIAGITGESIARAQAEILLRESEERYRMIIDRVADVIWKLDLSGKVIFVTPSVESLLGYSVDEFMACSLDKIIDKQSKMEADRAIAEILEKRDFAARIIEQDYICKDGTKKQCEVTFSLLTDSAGQPSALIGVTRDISRRKEMEDKLRQSEKMEAIGQLAGGVAHDFNNQLAGILGYADLLREEVSNNQELSRYADNILIGVKRAADLTSQLLAFSRQGKYQTTTVNFHRIIFEVVNILGHTIDKRISIRQELTANPATTLGDPTQLQNAVLNLALNARDAMPTGGELTFSTEVVDLDEEYCENNPYKIIPGKYLKVCITDTGTGMDEETIQHIFEPFFTTKEQGKGTGMGLAAVYGTVKNHNGAINVYSEPGKGTTFTIYLPLYVEDEVELGKDLQTTSTVKGSAHVLLVEDEDIVRAAAAEMMEKLGYKVSICSNGVEAVTFYKKSWQSVDLVIIDMVMPEMNGKDAFIAMREINPAIVALLASGYSLNGEARTILDEGVQGFIQKPFRKNELSQKIAEVLTSNN